MLYPDLYNYMQNVLKTKNKHMLLKALCLFIANLVYKLIIATLYSTENYRYFLII